MRALLFKARKVKNQIMVSNDQRPTASLMILYIENNLTASININVIDKFKKWFPLKEELTCRSFYLG